MGATRWVDPGRPVVGPAEARWAHLAAAGSAVAVAALLAGSARAGRPGVVVGVGLVQALLVPAWVLGTRRPGRIGGIVLGLAAAGAADAALLVRDRTSPGVLLGVLGLTFPALLAHQLTRGVVRVRVTESLAGITVAVTAAVGLATLVALARAVDGPRLVAGVALAAGGGLVVARLVDAATPRPRIAEDVPHGLLAVLLAAAAGAVAGHPGPAGAGVGALVGGLAALTSVGVGYVNATLPERPHPLALAYLGVALPLALAAPVGYVAALAVAG